VFVWDDGWLTMQFLPKAEAQRFVRFVLSGGFSAVVNAVARWLLSAITVYELAVAIAYVIGMTTAFVLARWLVFEPSRLSVTHQFGRFALVNVVSFIQVWLVSVGLARFIFPLLDVTWHAETIAHIIGLSSLVLTSYYAHQRYSFGGGSRCR
jgi:putative flippase GtrA